MSIDVPYHYYANSINDTKECKYYVRGETNLHYGHKLITEKAVFARWSTRHNLNFHYPTWDNGSATNTSSTLDTLFLRLYKDEPLRQRTDRRNRMLKLREQFKRRLAAKRTKFQVNNNSFAKKRALRYRHLRKRSML